MASRGRRRTSLPFENTLGPLIKEARERKGLSQYELGQLIDAQPAFISKIETGYTKQPAVQYLYPLAQALDIPYAVIYEAATGIHLSEDPAARELPPNIYSFAIWLAGLNEQQQKVAMDVARAAVDAFSQQRQQ